jgi:hypothetical protein
VNKKKKKKKKKKTSPKRKELFPRPEEEETRRVEVVRLCLLKRPESRYTQITSKKEKQQAS